MMSSWQTETGHLVCRWAGSLQRVRFDLRLDATDVGDHGSYLPPLPNLATHSPFGGVFWFQPTPLYFVRSKE